MPRLTGSGLAGFDRAIRSERTECVLGVHCLDSWGFSTTAWGELKRFPEILHWHYINCYVTFVYEKSLAILTLARALITSQFSALVLALSCEKNIGFLKEVVLLLLLDGMSNGPVGAFQ